MNFQIIYDKLKTKLVKIGKFSPRVVSQNCIKLSNLFILPFGITTKSVWIYEEHKTIEANSKESFL